MELTLVSICFFYVEISCYVFEFIRINPDVVLLLKD